MCGIAGFLTNEIGRVFREELIEALRLNSHRGPDSNGYIFEGDFGMAHNRLSIQDLSDKANQPFWSKCKRYVIIYNGEVYNYKALREKYSLELSSDSDTEVVIELFAKLGVDHVFELNGFFAYAIYDTLDQSFFLFRDRAGVKPLYYFQDKGLFCFSSELNSLLAFKKVKSSTKISKRAVSEFLHFGFVSKGSIYENIHQLPAGYFGKVNKNGFFFQNYWSVESQYQHEKLRDEEEAIRKLDNLLVNSVRHRMVSDVNVGLLLSGGVDSSLITAIAARESRYRIDTFTVGFEDPNHDESRYARKISEHVSARHHEWTFTKDDFLRFFENQTQVFGEPFANTSSMPIMFLCEKISKTHKVVLSGEGSDELFGGYGTNLWADRLENPLVSNVLTALSPVFMKIPSSRYKRVGQLLQLPKKNELMQAHILSQEEYFFSTKELKNLLLANEIDYLPSLDNEEELVKEMDMVEKQSLFDFKYFLKENLLVNLDRSSMRYSIEAREPFLDESIISFAFNLHPALKFRNGIGKYILKKVLAKYLPDSYFDRPKQGLSTPLEGWLKKDFAYLIERYVNEDIVTKHGLVDFEFADKIKKSFLNSKSNSYLYNRVWALMLLHKWAEEHPI